MDLRTKREIVQALRQQGRHDLARIFAAGGLVEDLEMLASALVTSGEYIRGIARKTTERQDLIQQTKKEIQKVAQAINATLENI